jgi:hypothetical protein
MKRLTATAIMAAALGVMGTSPALAIERTTMAPASSAAASAYDPSVAAPRPGDLTWSQLATIVDTPNSYQEDTSDRSTVSPDASSTGAGCTIDTGPVYKRSSGQGFPYGAVGGKPTTTCGTAMVRMTQTTTLYKTVWWGLQKVAGPFTSSNAGQGTITQKNVIRACDDLRDTTFRMIVRNTGTFPTGSTGTASAYEVANLPCGTN